MGPYLANLPGLASLAIPSQGSSPVTAAASAAACRTPKRGPAWIDLAPRATAVKIARRFAGRALSRCEADFIDDVTTVVSELVTNAFKHGTPYESSREDPRKPALIGLGVLATPRYVHVYVRDTSTDPLQIREPDPVNESGRGLHIIEACTDAWWVSPEDDGKTVHAVMALPGAVLTQAEIDAFGSSR